MTKQLSDLLQAASWVAAVVGLMSARWQFRHRRAANFVAGWKAIQEGLQSPDVRFGRAVCRRLNAGNTTHAPLKTFPDPADWHHLLKALEQDVQNADWPNGVPRSSQLTQETPCAPQEYISKAVDAFDLAAVLAWHARIPGLWQVLVAEWQDGIIATWEAGAPFLKARAEGSRDELFECFSVLYESALHEQRIGRGWYPYRGPIRSLRSRPRWYLAWKARGRRADTMARVRSGGHQSH